MTEQKEALKPCPFCGSNAELQYHCGVRYVQCDDEDCAVSGPLRWTDGEAVAAWNESVKGEEAADELATLRAKLAERDALLRECREQLPTPIARYDDGSGVYVAAPNPLISQIDALTGGSNAEE